MDTANVIALRVNHKSMTVKQLLQRLRVDASMAAIGRCKDDLAIECWAESLGLAAQNAELQAAVTAFRRTNGLFTAAQTNGWLAAKGISLDELAALFSPQVLRSKLAQHIVTAEEIRLQFLEWAQQYDRAEISTIVMQEYGAAQELSFRVEEGSDFHQLARQYSSDAASSKQGGYVGFVRRNDLEPETAGAVFNAASGAVLGPFERKGGYSLVLVESLYPAELNETVTADIREQLFQYKLEAYRQTLDMEEPIWRL